MFTIRDRRWIESRLKHYELRCAWFDIVEIARKLLLTGFAILLELPSAARLRLPPRVALRSPRCGASSDNNWRARPPSSRTSRSILLHGRRAQSGPPPPRLHRRRRRLRRGGGARPLGGARRPRPHRRRRHADRRRHRIAVAQLRRRRHDPSRRAWGCAGGTRQRPRARRRRNRRRASRARWCWEVASCRGDRGERRAARRVRGSLRSSATSPAASPPLAAPPAIERWKAAGLTVRAARECRSERVARARAGSAAAAVPFSSPLSSAAAADRPSAFVVRASSSVTDEMIECSTTSRTVSMRI